MSKSLFPYAGSQAKNVAVFTLATNAAGGGAGLTVWLEGVAIAPFVPGGGDTPTTTGGTLDAALVVALAPLNASYTVTNAVGVVTVTRDDGARLLGVWGALDDANQTMTIDAEELGEALSTGLTTAATPAVSASGDGHSCESRYSEESGVSLCVRAQLFNYSGGAATARYQLLVRRYQGGWFVEPTFGVQTVTEPTGTTVIDSYPPVIQLFGVEEVQVQLLDDGGGGNLVDCNLTTWVHYA